MDRHRLFLLITSVILAAFCGCGEPQALPIQLHIDSTFSDVERAAIREAIEEWNDRAGARYARGDTVFEVVGYVDDTFDVGDFEDGRHVIYRISSPHNPDENYLQEIYRARGMRIIGYGPHSDCILIMYFFDAFLEEYAERLRLRAEEEGADTDFTAYLTMVHFTHVRNLILHELGHMLGIAHYNHREGVMNLSPLSFLGPITSLSDADIDAFCEIYPCR